MGFQPASSLRETHQLRWGARRDEAVWTPRVRVSQWVGRTWRQVFPSPWRAGMQERRASCSHPTKLRSFSQNPIFGVQTASSPRGVHKLRWGPSPPHLNHGLPGGKRPFGPPNQAQFYLRTLLIFILAAPSRWRVGMAIVLRRSTVLARFLSGSEG